MHTETFSNNKNNKNDLSLKQLKIVKRAQSMKDNKFNSSNKNTAVQKKKLAAIKMVEEPNYKFDKLFANHGDSIFPYFHYQIESIDIHNRNADQIDYTKDNAHFKNVTKKYLMPFNKRYVDPIPYRVKGKDNIFNPKKVDPVMSCFHHSKAESTLRFGDFVIITEQAGSYSTFFEPVAHTILEQDIEESLYYSDEAEISRLDNSDSEEDEDIESDREIDTNFDVEDEAFSSFILSSPIKTTTASPLKHDLLFRKLLKNNSPTKNLNNERSGLLSSLQNNFKTNTLGSIYARYDNSMTISAKGIMKMVDESLVSSDTELYNQSFSFLKKERSCFNTIPVINADDLINALDGEFEKPVN